MTCVGLLDISRTCRSVVGLGFVIANRFRVASWLMGRKADSCSFRSPNHSGPWHRVSSWFFTVRMNVWAGDESFGRFLDVSVLARGRFLAFTHGDPFRGFLVTMGRSGRALPTTAVWAK